MDQNKLTLKSQEALQAAQTKAVRYGHMEVDGEHLLLALLEQPEGLVPRLVQRMEVPLDTLKARVEQELDKIPRVSGPGAEPGKIYITQRLNRLLAKAEEEAQRLKDDYVSVEHLLLGLVDEGAASPGGRVLQQFGVTKDAVL
ncbi:MAG: Clp protease N-terminal domain-containing protein, partial [Acidobacteriota bacterium]